MSRMRWWRALAGLAMVLAVGVAGCAAEPAATPTQPPGSPAETATPGTGSAEAVSVRVVVSGGIAGAPEVHEVRRDDAASSSTTGRTDQVLALAESRPVRAFDGEQLHGPAPCCDVQVFEVSIRYSDGRRTHIRTAQTLRTPPELDRLLDLVVRSG